MAALVHGPGAAAVTALPGPGTPDDEAALKAPPSSGSASGGYPWAKTAPGRRTCQETPSLAR